MTVLAARAAASPLLVAAARLWIAALLLLAAMLLTADRSHPRLSQATHGPSRPHGSRYSTLGRCVLMGGCMAGYQAAYFTAVTLSGIAVTALVAICSAPLIIAALAPWALGERLTPRVRVALALGVVGTALLVLAPHGALDLTARLGAGALLALAAGLAYALYALGLRHVPASVAGIVTLTEPFTATFLGVLLFGERLGVTGVLGALLLCAALGLVLGPPGGRLAR